MSIVRSDLTWSDVDRLTRTLARRLPDATEVRAFDRVVGVSRGGLIPAVLVASHLQIKRVESVQVRLYDGATRLQAPELVGPRPAPAGPSGDPCRTLVVDEIFDSGRTMRFLRRMLPEAAFAALVARQDATQPLERRHELSAYPWGADAEGQVWAAEAMATEDWILFPWSPPEDREARDEAP